MIWKWIRLMLALLISCVLIACGKTANQMTPTATLIPRSLSSPEPENTPKPTHIPLPTDTPAPTETPSPVPTATSTPQVGEVRKNPKTGAEEMYGSNGEWVEVVEIGTMRSRNGQAEIFSAAGWVEVVDPTDGEVREFGGLPMQWSAGAGKWVSILDSSDALDLSSEEYQELRQSIKQSNMLASERGLPKDYKNVLTQLTAFVAKIHYGLYTDIIPGVVVRAICECAFPDSNDLDTVIMVPIMFQNDDVLYWIGSDPNSFTDPGLVTEEAVRNIATTAKSGSIVQIFVGSKEEVLQSSPGRISNEKLSNLIDYSEEEILEFSTTGHMTSLDPNNVIIPTGFVHLK